MSEPGSENTADCDIDTLILSLSRFMRLNQSHPIWQKRRQKYAFLTSETHLFWRQKHIFFSSRENLFLFENEKKKDAGKQKFSPLKNSASIG
jgi:hypothetical protein